ncbi:MAG: hypothetical protein NW224_18120 [Leptolyngbyaceae cyanobacterium bins.302]|nr:hypothetical protein [Leptolyngbyaceae cyanobacterium bins.302]
MHLLLLLIWIAIATLLRFTNLEAKPVWADEFSTLVFSLGNRFLSVPLDRVLSWNELLQPLQPHPQATLHTVIQNLFTESNHPPLYFLLTHLWLKLFPTDNGLVSVGAARSLSALFGVLAVPGMFAWGWLTFRSRLIGQIAAALMAVSPFGIYLAQEARHYTLAVLWILASLCCMAVVARRIRNGRRIPLWLCLLWIAVNGLGVATHYFVLLSLLAETIAFILWFFTTAYSSENLKGVSRNPIPPCEAWRSLPPSPISPSFSPLPDFRRLLLVAVGTVTAVLAWLPLLLNIRGTELTRWIQAGEFDHSSWIDQLLRPIAALISMLYLLPIQGVPTWMVILFGIVAALLLGWSIPLLYRGWLNQAQDPETRSMLQLIGGFVGAAFVLSFVLTFGFGINFTSVFRYQFIYFPGVVGLFAVALSNYWKYNAASFGIKAMQMRGNVAIALVVLFSLLGGITVTADLAYQRTHRPDQVAAAVHQSFQHPTLIAIPHKTHAHTTRLMAIAWELHRLSPTEATQSSFLLAHYPNRDVQLAVAALQTALPTLPRPFDVWRINFRSQANPLSHTVLSNANCVPASKLSSVDGYRYQQYQCP